MLKKPCRKCGKPGKALCDTCAALEPRKPRRDSRSSTQRGYDAEYVANRNEIVRQVLAVHGFVACILCGRTFVGCRPSAITAEHIVPKRKGGTNAMSNLGPAHSRCNFGWRRKR